LIAVEADIKTEKALNFTADSTRSEVTTFLSNQTGSAYEKFLNILESRNTIQIEAKDIKNVTKEPV